MKKKIHWSSWHYNWIEDEHMFKSAEKNEVDKDTYTDSYDENLGEIGTLVATPFGMFKIDDGMNPFRQFKFWMGNTNFDITEEIGEIIEGTPGVEVLHFLTRYKFLIAVGELFRPADVKIDIQNKLCSDSEVSLLDNKIADIVESVSQYEKWSIYVFPNGNYEAVYLDGDEDKYQELVQLHEQAYALSNGYWITNDSIRTN